MSVETFDPGNLSQPLSADAVSDALSTARAFAADNAERPDLADVEIARLAPIATHKDWSMALDELSDADLEALIRLFTAGEWSFPSWQAGDKSPVIILVRALKQRGAFHPELSKWIKAHSDNRYLPHGSLADRL